MTDDASASHSESWTKCINSIEMIERIQRRGAQLPYLADAVKTRVYLWRRRAATIAAGALVLVMGYGVVFGHNGLTAFAKKREEAKTLERQTQELQRENEALRGHVDRLQSDPGEIEHEARAQLHYTRPGEVIYTVSGSTAMASDADGETKAQNQAHSSHHIW